MGLIILDQKRAGNGLGLLDHPIEGNVRQTGLDLGIAAANVRVISSELHLDQRFWLSVNAAPDGLDASPANAVEIGPRLIDGVG